MQHYRLDVRQDFTSIMINKWIFPPSWIHHHFCGVWGHRVTHDWSEWPQLNRCWCYQVMRNYPLTSWWCVCGENRGEGETWKTEFALITELGLKFKLLQISKQQQIFLIGNVSKHFSAAKSGLEESWFFASVIQSHAEAEQLCLTFDKKQICVLFSRRLVLLARVA